MASSGKELRELRKETITEYPQVLRNVHVADKHKLEGAELLWAAVRDAEARLDKTTGASWCERPAPNRWCE